MTDRGQYEIELKIHGREDRKTVMAILADNGYDVGQHKKRKQPNGKSYDYCVHAQFREENASSST